jgi:hypothetical protein
MQLTRLIDLQKGEYYLSIDGTFTLGKQVDGELVERAWASMPFAALAMRRGVPCELTMSQG